MRAMLLLFSFALGMSQEVTAGSYACDEAQEAAQTLYSAAAALADCVAGGDLADCTVEADLVASAAVDYDSARSDLDDPDDCY
ncbi:MAG: hypothetical protein RLW61_04635 [Gammaproteobacteria bacterium]